MPVTRYIACDIAWHRGEQLLAAVCGVAPVATIVPVFPVGTYWHYIETILLLYTMCNVSVAGCRPLLWETLPGEESRRLKKNTSSGVDDMATRKK